MSDNTVLERALAHATEYLSEMDRQKTGIQNIPDDIRKGFESKLNQSPIAAEQVIDELAASVKAGLIGSAGGRFFGWVIGGTLPAALAADWLASTWDENAALYACSPSASIVEEISANWLKDLLLLPNTASVGFVTGCQMAHFTCLAAARNKLLQDCGWNVEEQGVNGAPIIEIATSGARHESLIRAARFLGLGRNSLIEIDTTDDGKINLQALEQYLKNRKGAPTIVVLQAGDINTGRFDPFNEACDLGHKYNAWIHVDGAFGLWAAVSDKYKRLVAGIEKADSWSTDGHKWLNVPFDSGLAFVAHPEHHRAAMTTDASYLIADNENRDQIDWNPDWSRKARGYAIYAALRSLGRQGIADIIEKCCDNTKKLVVGIAALPNTEVLAEPTINQGLIRFLSNDGDHDKYTNEVITQIQKSGEAWFGGTTWRSQRAMRISVCNWRTNSNDVERAIASVKSAIEEVAKK